MQYVVADLEASCWEAAWVRHRMETIEIGAVRLDESLSLVDEFDAFVRPVVVPRLSSFCRKLTSISQEQVDAADTFPKVFARFVTWLGPGPRRLVTWGAFDLGQLRLDCQRHDMVFPEHVAAGHLNLAMNEWGHVVGTSETAEGEPHAFLWRNGKMHDLGTLGGASSSAYAINNRGQVVGVSETADGESHAFLWQNGKMTDLGAAAGPGRSEALDINDRGQIVGYVLAEPDDRPAEAGDRRAVMWTVKR